MTKRREKKRRKKTKFSFFDTFVFLFASSFIIGFVYYFFTVNSNRDQDGIKRQPETKQKNKKSKIDTTVAIEGDKKKEKKVSKKIDAENPKEFKEKDFENPVKEKIEEESQKKT